MSTNDALRKDLTPDEFGMFRDWIHKHSGIFLEDSKMDSLRISLVTRATRFGYTDYSDYFRMLTSDEDEFKELMNLVTINETSFFRFPGQFTALRDAVIPEIVDGRSTDAVKRFRVWSAGCSTGEEPYTIAMTLLESALGGLGYTSEVVGTDVSTQALDRARKGVYPARALTSLQQQVIQRWFEPVKDGHRPVKRVRELCAFHYHNLIKEPYPLAFMSNWDVIFCRNVTIYFKLESTRRVVDRFHEALNPGGYLFIGHSETLTSVSDKFEPVEINGVFLYRKLPQKRFFNFDDIVERRQKASGPARGEVADRARKTLRRLNRVERPVVEERDQVADLVAQAYASLENASAAEALVLAHDAIRLEPGNISAHLAAASAYADLGKLDEAKGQANEVLSTFPLTAGARYILGVIYQQEGDVASALAEFKKTLYIDRDFVLAHFAVANILRQQGQLHEACREYENTLRALRATPEGPWTAFLGGFKPDLLARTCERSLLECGRGD